MEFVEAFLSGITLYCVIRFLTRSLRRRPPESPKPVCGCTHHYSMHDPGNGMKCNVAIYNADKYRGPCACARYAGPEPLPEFYAPDITSG